MSAQGFHIIRKLSPEAETGFVNIDNMMAKARAKHGTQRIICPSVETSASSSLTEEADFEERFKDAYSKSRSLISQTNAQLATDVAAPVQLTIDEWTDETQATVWMAGFNRADDITHDMSIANDMLYEDVIDATYHLTDDEALLLDREDVVKGPALAKQGSLKAVPEDVRQWLAENKKRWKDYLAREASSKPVMVFKPEEEQVEPTGKKAASVGAYFIHVLNLKRR